MSDTSEPVMIKAFAVVEAILELGRPLSLPELAEHLGRPKQTIHRTAKQLEQHGFLYREPLRDRYAIGPKLFDISKDVMTWWTRYAPRHAILGKLVDAVGETCNVGILDDDAVLYLDRVESNFPLRADLQRGSRVPIHCTGLGKLFLAHMSTRTRKRVISRISLTKHTRHTITDPGQLEIECQKIRRRGFSVNEEEYHDGIISVAVPMYSELGQVISGLAIHAPAMRVDVDTAIAMVPTLKEFAAKMADDLTDEADPTT